jgi:hypothetical protein
MAKIKIFTLRMDESSFQVLMQRLAGLPYSAVGDIIPTINGAISVTEEEPPTDTTGTAIQNQEEPPSDNTKR